jgi:branched-subunit amino acid aminotransferase/4-amino-4-deoxychorismate lyase
MSELGGGRECALPIESDACELLEANGLAGAARLRVVALKTQDGSWTVEATARPCGETGPTQRPARLGVQTWLAAPPLVGHKTLSRMAWDLARERSIGKGFDDVLLVDADDRLLETSIANVWLVNDGVVRTPRAPSRCLPGVMRRWLLENLDTIGLTAEVGEVTTADLGNAEEMWLSNAVAGLRRVASADDREWTRWPVFDTLVEMGVPAPGWPERGPNRGGDGGPQPIDRGTGRGR